jgi:phosphoribosyl-AMP cyclohydrolase
MTLPPEIADRLKRNADGLICAVIQEYGTNEVLTVAWMNDEALDLTLRTRKGTYWSRSRQQLWVKGETSGHTQYVREVRLDCDADAVLVIVEQTGPACHTNAHSCFGVDDEHDRPAADVVLLADAGSEASGSNAADDKEN